MGTAKHQHLPCVSLKERFLKKMKFLVQSFQVSSWRKLKQNSPFAFLWWSLVLNMKQDPPKFDTKRCQHSWCQRMTNFHVFFSVHANKRWMLSFNSVEWYKFYEKIWICVYIHFFPTVCVCALFWRKSGITSQRRVTNMQMMPQTDTEWRVFYTIILQILNKRINFLACIWYNCRMNSNIFCYRRLDQISQIIHTFIKKLIP